MTILPKGASTRSVHSLRDATSRSLETSRSSEAPRRRCNEIIVPIFALRAFRAELEACPIECFVPCLLPAALARGVVIESDNEGFAAVVCVTHELSRNGRPCAIDSRQRIAAGSKKAVVVAKSVNGRLDSHYAARLGNIPTTNEAESLFPRHGRNTD
jgi:hypothetical protein